MILKQIGIITMLAGFIFSPSANATVFPDTTTPFSKYGQIQNVQNYSSNPFWTPNSPYNQRMPQPIYVQGTDVDTGDCQRVVEALITSYCAPKNNCLEVSLEDIRPTLIIQLASLPNHNFATACSGFIDESFKNYKAQNANAAPKGNQVVSFPTATAPNTGNTKQEIIIQNPFAPNVPDWAQEMQERKNELKQLQTQNGAGNEHLAKAAFPTTVADLSFTERMENAAAGYEPYKGKSAYRQINVINDSPELVSRKTSYCNEELQRLAIIEADIATLQNCQKNNYPIQDCLKTLKGRYM